jgi:hypothetical protein
MRAPDSTGCIAQVDPIPSTAIAHTRRGTLPGEEDGQLCPPPPPPPPPPPAQMILEGCGVQPASATSSQARFRRHILLLGVLVASSLVALLTASPAFAGEPPPPSAHGFVTYDRVTGSVDCSNGHASTATFSFSYNARHLRRRPYHLVVDYFTFNASGAGNGPFGTTRVPVTPKRGRRHFAHTFAIGGHAPGETTISFEAHLVGSSDDDYRFVSRDVQLKCPTHKRRALVAPTASFSPINCHGKFTVTFNGRHATFTTQWIIYGSNGRTDMATVRQWYVKPGQIRHFTFSRAPGFAPRDSVEVQFNAGVGRDDIGRFKLRSGCA